MLIGLRVQGGYLRRAGRGRYHARFRRALPRTVVLVILTEDWRRQPMPAAAARALGGGVIGGFPVAVFLHLERLADDRRPRAFGRLR